MSFCGFFNLAFRWSSWRASLVPLIWLQLVFSEMKNTDIFHLLGFSFSSVYHLGRNQDPAPRLHYCFLAAPPLSLHPLRSLISNCLNLPFGTQERSGRLESVPYKQGMGDMERLPCPGAPQGPVQFQPWTFSPRLKPHSAFLVPRFKKYKDEYFL